MTSSPRISCFDAIATPAAKLVILGSMPGEASLNAQQYYAHPRNAFWPIICDYLHIPLTSSYAEKLCALSEAQIAVWDVLAQCERKGSLDSNIQKDSVLTNDFNRFFENHAQIGAIFFNGGTAEKLFRRHVLPSLTKSPQFYTLPSTSPAHAAISFDDKKHRWHTALKQALES